MANEPSQSAIAWQLERLEFGKDRRDAIAALISQNESAPIVERLAAAFACELAATLSLDDLAEVRARNALPAYDAPICASHDFCDANECMDSAFRQVMGREFMPEDAESVSPEDCALWGQAWSIARARYLEGIEPEPEPEPCPIHRQPVDRCSSACPYHE